MPLDTAWSAIVAWKLGVAERENWLGREPCGDVFAVQAAAIVAIFERELGRALGRVALLGTDYAWCAVGSFFQGGRDPFLHDDLEL